MDDPRRAPTVELQEFFREQRGAWQGAFRQTVQCQVEADRDRIDDILFRRHTGTQNGIGQSTWDDRMKENFVQRTGKGGGINVADEIEKRLNATSLLPARRKLPRSTLNRLLSAEAFRNRVGITVSRGRFDLRHEEPVVLAALSRIANDLADRTVVLGTCGTWMESGATTTILNMKVFCVALSCELLRKGKAPPFSWLRGSLR